MLRPIRKVGDGIASSFSNVARGDDGVMLAGRSASGVVSGSVARMSGTSMAAPQVARALLCYFLSTPVAEQSATAERIALTGHPDWTLPDPRMGHGALRTEGVTHPG